MPELRELNQVYRKTLAEEIQTTRYCLPDFGKVCMIMKLPFFVVQKTINRFEEPYEQTETKIYETYEAFRETMPYWSARMYDHSDDCPTHYYAIKHIPDGVFEIKECDLYTEYEWKFLVTDTAVLVNQTYTHLFKRSSTIIS